MQKLKKGHVLLLLKSGTSLRDIHYNICIYNAIQKYRNVNVCMHTQMYIVILEERMNFIPDLTRTNIYIYIQPVDCFSLIISCTRYFSSPNFRTNTLIIRPSRQN